MLTYRYKLYKLKNGKYLETHNDIACEIWNRMLQTGARLNSHKKRGERKE